MSETKTTATLRAGSPAKRAAILAAARDLFLRDGVHRVSMDAVAAAAGVSKRTVYDYFGDKQRLVLGVVEEAGESLLRSIGASLDRHLGVDRGIDTVAALEDALTGFTTELATVVVGSADYSTVFAIVSQLRGMLDDLETLVVGPEPEDLLAERFGYFADRGLLDAPDPRLAADHFTALTLLLAYHDQPDPTRADPARVRERMADGIRTFIRAYGARPA